ncbi:MAG: alkaline phosphatase D family protein [Chloroherpetonaceae bacterium]|nr:alkaline phosphatase D family protein [Chloroherpetonaceae bacterium]
MQFRPTLSKKHFIIPILQFIFVLLFFSLLLQELPAQTRKISRNNSIRSGPMLGYSEMREVLIWVQTLAECEVWAEYIEEGIKNEAIGSTNRVKTEREKAFTAKLIAADLEPGKRYVYWIVINGKRQPAQYPQVFQTLSLWQWRKDAPNVTFAIGSCAYINEERFDRSGKPYGEHYDIFSTIAGKSPDFMVWLGDNTYLRDPDWGSRSGILYRYSHTRELKELQPLLASVHHYAIWDDHDYGSNDADNSFIGKQLTREAFTLFWGNPTYGMDGKNGITTSFRWSDAEFFLLDDRWFKSPNKRRTGKREIIGESQFEWLINSLSSSQATFKFIVIGGQVLNSAAIHENFSTYPEERKKLLDAILAEKISGVIFLTGDRHYTSLSKMNREGTYPLYDLTVSPLTSGTYQMRDEVNDFLIPETYLSERNFGLLKLEGKGTERKLVIEVFTWDGKKAWVKEILAKDLK